MDEEIRFVFAIRIPPIRFHRSFVNDEEMQTTMRKTHAHSNRTISRQGDTRRPPRGKYRRARESARNSLISIKNTRASEFSLMTTRSGVVSHIVFSDERKRVFRCGRSTERSVCCPSISLRCPFESYEWRVNNSRKNTRSRGATRRDKRRLGYILITPRAHGNRHSL